MNSHLFMGGLALACARRHPWRPFQLAGRGLSAVWTVLDSPALRSMALLVGITLPLVIQTDSSPALAFAAILATQLRWGVDGAAVKLGQMVRASAAGLAAGKPRRVSTKEWQEKIRRSTDHDLRRLAHAIHRQMLGAAPAARKDLRQQRAHIVDELRARRAGQRARQQP